MWGELVNTLAQASLILAIFTAVVQGYRFTADLIVLGKRVGSKVPLNVGWGCASVAYWIFWVVLR